MTQDDERLNEIASLLARLAPDGSKALKFAYRAVGSSFEQAFIPDGMAAAEARLPQSGIHPLLRDLRTRMYEDGDGTWLEMDLTVRSRPEAASLADDDAPAWEVRYKSVDEITFADEITPLAASEELRMFPQEARRVPPLDGGPVLRPGHGGPVRPPRLLCPGRPGIGLARRPRRAVHGGARATAGRRAPRGRGPVPGGPPGRRMLVGRPRAPGLGGRADGERRKRREARLRRPRRRRRVRGGRGARRGPARR
ncbi:hypothetical protein [Actinomadura madurae]|uniref:hypothetical protein n=1 Tax=Actinomadura madurae TaxID=1993 RepID=UPI0020D22F6E|nr:hypothetical protein [Actinomadura madurae]MCQ0016259.1 hypothetical protein [Actinomadura madurae]